MEQHRVDHGVDLPFSCPLTGSGGRDYLRIEDVHAFTCEIPVQLPGLTRKALQRFVVAIVTADNGMQGHGVAGPKMTSAIQAFINNEAKQFLLGYDPLATEKIWLDALTVFGQTRVASSTGVWSCAIGAIDVALWDLKGKYLQQPVARLLGGARDKVKAYVTFGVPEYGIAGLVEFAQALVRQGHRRLKMCVGAGADGSGNTLASDFERVKAVREAIGDEIELMVDGNYLLSLDEAERLCRAIEPFNIRWFEEPVYGNDFRLLRELRRKTTVPIAAGQRLGNLWQHRELIVNHAVDISQPNPCHCGGYTEALKVANLARAFNLPLANGGGCPYYNVHFHAGVPNGGEVEYHWTSWKASAAILKNAPEPRDGYVTAPDRPGLGFELDMERVSAYRVSG